MALAHTPLFLTFQPRRLQDSSVGNGVDGSMVVLVLLLPVLVLLLPELVLLVLLLPVLLWLRVTEPTPEPSSCVSVLSSLFPPCCGTTSGAAVAVRSSGRNNRKAAAAAAPP